MLKKLKIKFTENKGKGKVFNMPILGIFLMVFLFGMMVPSGHVVRAATCQQNIPNDKQICNLGEISFTTSAYVVGADGKKDNFARVGKDSSVQIFFETRLSSPDYIKVDNDEIQLDNAPDRNITGFGWGLISKAQTTTSCVMQEQPNAMCDLQFGCDRTKFLSCELPYVNRSSGSRTVQKGEIAFSDKVTVSGADLESKYKAVLGSRIEIYAVPNLYYWKITPGDRQTTYNGAGKSLYFEVYATQAEAAQKDKDLGKPADVPQYGENTGGINTETSSEGGMIFKIIEWVIGFLLGLIQELIYVVFYWFVVPLIQGMLSIRTYTDTFVAVIYPGWEIVRNVCNIIFIVALIAIAMGTLLRVEAYKSKQVLVQLILAALLVNFSLVIGQAILGVADTVQNQFLPNNSEVIRALGKDLMVSYRSIIYDSSGMQLSGNFAGVLRHIIFVTLSAGSFMVFLILAAYLFIRVVMLWVLLMISPLAYAAGALPSTAHYRQEWWQQFIKYAFFTPIMAFFINLTAIIATQQKTNPILKAIGVSEAEFGGSGLAKMVFQVGGNLIMLVFLVVGMKVAEKFGIMGASKLTSFAQKGMYLPVGLGAMGAKGLGGFVRRSLTEKIGEKIGEHSGIGQKEEDRMKAAMAKHDVASDEYNKLRDDINAGRLSGDDLTKAQSRVAELSRKMGDHQKIIDDAKSKMRKAGLKSAGFRALSFFDPKVLKEAWKKREHEKDAKAYEPAIGYMQDTLNRIVPAEWLKKGGIPGKKTFHGLVAKRALISKETKELQEGVRTRDDAFKIADAAFESKDKHLIHAAFKILQHGNWQDDYMNARGRVSKTHSILNYMKELREMMHENGFDHEEMLEVLDDLQETGEDSNRIRAYGYRCTDDDGVVRAAFDLGYLEKLEKEDPSAFRSEIEKLQNGFQSAYEETKVPEFKAIADKFQEAIANNSSLENIKKIKYGEGEGESLEDAIVQRRFLTEANVKLQRGAAMGHARAMEPAIFCDQDPEKGWVKLNLLGLMAMKEMPPTILKAWLSRMHEGQARPLKAFGAVQDADSGKWQLPDFEKAQDPSSGAAGEQHMEAIVRLTQVIKANPQIFTEVVENKDLFGALNVEKFKKDFEQFVISNPQYGVTQEMIDNVKREVEAKNASKGGGKSGGATASPGPATPPTP